MRTASLPTRAEKSVFVPLCSNSLLVRPGCRAATPSAIALVTSFHQCSLKVPSYFGAVCRRDAGARSSARCVTRPCTSLARNTYCAPSLPCVLLRRIRAGVPGRSNRTKLLAMQPSVCLILLCRRSSLHSYNSASRVDAAVGVPEIAGPRSSPMQCRIQFMQAPNAMFTGFRFTSRRASVTCRPHRHARTPMCRSHASRASRAFACARCVRGPEGIDARSRSSPACTRSRCISADRPAEFLFGKVCDGD